MKTVAYSKKDSALSHVGSLVASVDCVELSFLTGSNAETEVGSQKYLVYEKVPLTCGCFINKSKRNAP